MIQAEFYQFQGNFSGFRISGHAGYANRGKDVVCAAVSSAVQLMLNMLDKFGFSPDVKIGENVIRCTVDDAQADASAMIEQLKLHFESILEEFPNTIKITISEV